MTTKQRYLFALVDGGGTVPPELAVVRRLVARGHDVIVLAEDSMEAEVRASRRDVRAVDARTESRLATGPEHDPFRDWECKNPMQLFDRLLDTAARRRPRPRTPPTSTPRSPEHRRPTSSCASSSRFGAMVAARSRAGMPFYVLMPNVYLMPAEGMPPFGLGLRPAKGPLGRTRDRLHAPR